MKGNLYDLMGLDAGSRMHEEQCRDMSHHNLKDVGGIKEFAFGAGDAFDPSLQFSYEDGHLGQFVNPALTLDNNGPANYVLKHGLMTPPSTTEVDSTDKVVAISTEDGRVDPHSPYQKRNSTKRKRSETKPAGRTTQSKRARIQTTRKARAGYKATCKEEENDPEGEEKRQRFLERNRDAATKCRQKRKLWEDRLEEQFREGQAKHRQLVDMVTGLQSELIQLKEEALKHFDCNPNIRNWLTGRIGRAQSTTNWAPVGKEKEQETQHRVMNLQERQPDSLPCSTWAPEDVDIETCL